MARYTGPRTKISRRFGVALSARPNPWSAAISHQASTASAPVVRRSRSIPSLSVKNRSSVSNTVFLKNSSADTTRKPPAAVV